MTRRRDDPEDFDGRPFRANGASLFSPFTPWWIRVALTGGFPILVATFFMAMFAGWIPSPWTAIKQLTEANAAALSQHEQTTQLFVGRLTKALQIMCENQAQTVQQQRNCWNIQ